MLDIRQTTYQKRVNPAEVSEIKHSAGTQQVTADSIKLNFKANKDVYQLAFDLPAAALCNGLYFRIKLAGWQELKYVAIGYEKAEHFLHVKAPNVCQEEWFDFGFSHYDLAFRMQNKWQLLPPCQIEKIKIYIKGSPKADFAELSVAEGMIWQEQASSVTKPIENKAHFNAKLITVIKNYWKKCYPEYLNQGQAFFDHGYFPIGSYPIMTNNMPWEPISKKPININSPTTYRYSWHALNAVSVFLLACEQKTLSSLMFTARELVNQWLDDSYHSPDPDQKYCWYDHGAAERTLVLLVIWQIGLKQNFDYRFMVRVQDALSRHAQLLASEAFYAGHQPYRYHNHAWFQDIALIASGVALSHLPGAKEWIVRGEQRLSEQLRHLIVRDGAFAVFTENSIGYHQGVQRLVDFAGELLDLAQFESDIKPIARELNEWTKTFCYPDGRFPAQGDTFRKPNPISRNSSTALQTWSTESILLKKAGYLFVRGGVKTKPWVLTMVATSLNQTHKHQDDLALTFWFDGVEWLTDPSFFSHEYSKEVPAFLRSAAAHNMMWLPLAEYNIQPESNRTQLVLQQQSPVTRVIGSSRACRGYTITRKVEYQVKQRLPFIVGEDSFASDKPFSDDATGILNFHFGDGVSVHQHDSETNLYVLSHPASDYHLLLTVMTEPENIEIKTAACGLAFMESTETMLMNIGVKPKQTICWNIKAERVNGRN